jgi:nicotinamidase-related amidase
MLPINQALISIEHLEGSRSWWTHSRIIAGKTSFPPTSSTSIRTTSATSMSDRKQRCWRSIFMNSPIRAARTRSPKSPRNSPRPAASTPGRRSSRPRIFYTTGDTREGSKPGAIKATNRRGGTGGADAFTIRPEWAPQPGDVVITKQRASGFFGTPLTAHLTQLGIDTIIIIGESTSGCVRASTVDGYSNGYHMVMVEECCFDRSEISHKVNLFDLHHKYADVMKVDEVVATLSQRAVKEIA